MSADNYFITDQNLLCLDIKVYPERVANSKIAYPFYVVIQIFGALFFDKFFIPFYN